MKCDLTLVFHDTFYEGNNYLGFSMVELIKPSCQVKLGTQKLFFHVLKYIVCFPKLDRKMNT